MKIKMSKGRNIVSSFSYPEEFEVVMRELHVLAAREGKEKSQLIREILTEYVSAHSKGNNTFTLDTWQEDPEFQALPTLMASEETWRKHIDKCTDKELTKIGIQSGFIRGYVEHIRANQFRKK